MNHFLLNIATAIIPLIYIINSFYNAPTGDDLWFVANSKQYGFGGALSSFFYEHTGRVFGVFVNLCIAKFYDFGFSYKVAPIAILLIAWLVIRYSLLTYQRVEKREIFYITNLVLALFLTAVPNIYEVLYWTASSTLHVLPFFISILYITNIEKSIPKQVKPISVLLILIIGLSNEFLLLLILVYHIVNMHRQPNYSKLIIPLLLTLVMFHVFCPGNLVRYKIHDDAQQFSVETAVYHVGQFLFHFLKGVFLNPIFWYLVIRKPLFIEARPRLSTLNYAILISSVLFPIVSNYVLTKQMVAPLRVVNTSISIGIVLLLFFLPTFQLTNRFRTNNRYLKVLLWSLIVPYCFLTKNSLSVVTMDLFSGKSKRYSEQVLVRIDRIKNSESNEVVVPNFESQPKSLCMYDIGTDSKVGEYLGRIYGKSKVRTAR